MIRSLLLFILLLTAPALAQPRLDSIAINEETQELQLFGEFDPMGELVVLCDSVSLPVTYRDQFAIHASIPDSGKGSCGWVTAAINEVSSNGKLITYWHFYSIYYWLDLNASEIQYDRAMDTIYLRGDALSAYTTDQSLRAVPVRISTYSSLSKGIGKDHSESGRPIDTFLINLRGHTVGIYDPVIKRWLRFTDGKDIKVYEEGNACGQWASGSCSKGGPLTDVRFAPVQSGIQRTRLRPAPTFQLLMISGPEITFRCSKQGNMLVFNSSGVKALEVFLSAGINSIPLSGLPKGSYFALLEGAMGASIPFFVK